MRKNIFCNALCSLAGILSLALPVTAQISVGDNVDMSLNGTVSLGYTNTNGSNINSSHSLNVGGSGTLAGSYYDPNFFNFTLSPYYNQSSQNSASRSLFNSSGLDFSSGIFGGSHFPGSVTLSKSWNSQGNFGILGVPNYTTKGNGQGFGIGWGAFFEGFPSLSANFNTGSSGYSVLGANQNGTNSYKNFNLRSNYSVAGFSLNAGYNIGNSNAEIPLIFSSGLLESVNSSGNSWFVGASHALPLHGSASASFSRSYVNSDYLGYSFNGTIDTLNAFAGVTPTQKLSLSAAMGYSDNLAGSLYQSILPTNGVASQNGAITQAQNPTTGGQQTTGGLVQQSEQSSNALYISGYGAYALAPNLQLNFQAQRRQQTYLGKSYGSNSYGAGTVYTRPLLGGSMNASVNFSDNTADYSSGNALSFTTNFGYNRSFAGWSVSGDVSYAQNVQTFLLTYMNSFYIYSGNVRHRFGRWVWTGSAAGSHSAISNEPGTGNGGESFSTSLGGRRLTLAASYSKTNGYGLLSGNGITLPPTLPPGVIPPEWLLLYGGSGYAFSVGSSPVRRLSLAASFSRADSNTVNGLISSANHNEQIFANMNYQFRKLTLSSGYGRLVQGFSASGLPASNVNSFYIGVSRYFNFF